MEPVIRSSYTPHGQALSWSSLHESQVSTNEAKVACPVTIWLNANFLIPLRTGLSTLKWATPKLTKYSSNKSCFVTSSCHTPSQKEKWGLLVQPRREVHLSHCQHGALYIDGWQGDAIAPTICRTDSSVWGCAEHQEVTNDGTILEPLAARERRSEHHFFCGALTEGHRAPMSTLPMN